MNLKPVLVLSLMFVLAPVWIGTIWRELLCMKGRASRVLHAWVFGFATMLAAGQLVFVPMVALGRKLSEAQAVWEFCMELLAAAAFVLFLMKWGGQLFAGEKDSAARTDSKRNAAADKKDGAERGRRVFPIIFGVLAAVLILLQAYIPARYEHSDDDDARFIAEAVSAVVHDSMYQDSPIEADFMYWDVGEVRKDLTSPWAMFLAMQSNICGLAPAVLAHSYLPFFLILLCYGLYTSTHTLASMLLLRIWQGKAVCASFLLPLLFYLFCRILKGKGTAETALLYVTAAGGCMLSGIGIVTSPIVVMIYGIVDFCRHRKWKRLLAVWGAALPCAVFLGYYLFGKGTVYGICT